MKRVIEMFSAIRKYMLERELEILTGFTDACAASAGDDEVKRFLSVQLERMHNLSVEILAFDSQANADDGSLENLPDLERLRELLLEDMQRTQDFMTDFEPYMDHQLLGSPLIPQSTLLLSSRLVELDLLNVLVTAPPDDDGDELSLLQKREYAYAVACGINGVFEKHSDKKAYPLLVQAANDVLIVKCDEVKAIDKRMQSNRFDPEVLSPPFRKALQLCMFVLGILLILFAQLSHNSGEGVFLLYAGVLSIIMAFVLMLRK